VTGRTAEPPLRGYLATLAERDFRRLWLGASLSLLGDGMTFVALAWLVLDQPGGTRQLGLLAVCYTAPVLLGGLAVGPLLDRFDKRAVLAADSLVRGAAVVSIPLTAALGRPPSWLPFAVAAAYGLLKMVPLAGVPAAIPELVPGPRLDAANALESLSFGVAGIVGPALAGLLIPVMGAASVLAFDAATYLCFAVAVLTVRRPLRPDPDPAPRPAAVPRAGLTRLRRDRVLVVTTLAFMTFNIAEGMLLVVAPWLARTHLAGGAGSLGLLLAALSAGELAGAAAAGAWRPRMPRVRAIALVELVAAVGFLAVLAVPRTPAVAAGFLVIGAFSAPMTVWAQSLRMERVPPSLRGRTFALLRTLMQATPPVGAAAVTPLLARGQLGAAAALMCLLAGLPALGLLLLRTPPATRSRDGGGHGVGGGGASVGKPRKACATRRSRLELPGPAA
jgi:MFS family permease